MWETFPWGDSDGLECPPPMMSSGADTNPSSAGSVVVIGDSNVRNDQAQIEQSLADVGFATTFICWGGKQLPWGREQILLMANLGIEPKCLVINLGTNDLKGTTAQNLADAVAPGEVQRRLQNLLEVTQSFRHVIVVDVAANVDSAPGTMKRVDDLPRVFQDVSQAFSNTLLVSWSSYVATHPNAISDDGIHDSFEGAQARSALIANAVQRSCQ